MTSLSYKRDDGPSFPTDCFPARALQSRRKDGGGHRLVAYRKAEEQKNSIVNRRIKKAHKKQVDSAEANGNTLDGPFLLQLHCVDKPSELCSVDITEQKLNKVKPEDLKAFENVAYIDASVNSLSLASFSSFVSLRELSLCVNGIRSMTFDAFNFPHLEVLDLSYNSLSDDGIVSMGRLPQLKILHLTGNQLRHLPPNLGSSSCEQTQLLVEPAKEDDTRFRALEILMLDDNKLSSGVLNSVKNLNRLKYLNLQGNRISKIPYLHPMGCSDCVQTSTEKLTKEGTPEPNLEHEEKFRRISQDIPENNCKGSTLPLPKLQILDLSDNRIAEEEALMAVALFPMLREIAIHSNPLTAQRRGDPPLLTYHLKERLGITIKSKKTQEVTKPPLKVSTNPKWKVEERISKVPKKPTLMEAPCPAQTEEDKKSRDNSQFFFTQAADSSENEFDLQDDDKETGAEGKGKQDDNISSKFTHYDWMDAKPYPEAVQAIGIQTAVRMLEHTLKNLNVYRDSKPKLDSIQMPYRERKKRIQELPPLKPIQRPPERVDELIKQMRKSTTIRRVSLSSALSSTGGKREDYKEAVSLLRDLKNKYKMVHKKTMEHLASLESAGNTNVIGAQPLPVKML